jgi:hypothetical protein
MAGGGSRAGERRGGRKKGSRNKATIIREQEIAASGELPLNYMLRIMRDPNEDDQRRDEMAWRAAPYLHARLQAVDASVKVDMGLAERLERAIQRVRKAGSPTGLPPATPARPMHAPAASRSPSKPTIAPTARACRRQLRVTTTAAAVENDLAKLLSTSLETLLAARREDVMASFPTLTRDRRSAS